MEHLRDTLVMIFVDVNLAGHMNGVELALLARQKLPHVSVVLTSGSDGAENSGRHLVHAEAVARARSAARRRKCAAMTLRDVSCNIAVANKHSGEGPRVILRSRGHGHVCRRRSHHTKPPTAKSTRRAHVRCLLHHVGERRSCCYTANRGVTLAPDAIAWTFDGKADSAPFKNIVEVWCRRARAARLNPSGICAITFADRYRAAGDQRQRVRNPDRCAAGGLPRLHARPACAPRAHAAVRERPPIAFRAGLLAAKLDRAEGPRRIVGWSSSASRWPRFLMTGEDKAVPAADWRRLVLRRAASGGRSKSNAPLTYDPGNRPRNCSDDRKGTFRRLLRPNGDCNFSNQGPYSRYSCCLP